jgi:hypothetical protein
MSNVFDSPDVSPTAAHAAAEQRAAIDAMRARQAAAKGPTVFFPFGKQQPLAKYAGMKVVPFQGNPYVDRPERLLLTPDPGAHYGWVKHSDPAIRGKLRAGVYEAVYIDELKPDNDAPIATEDIMTERGPNKLVLWHGLALVRIPQRSYHEHYEMPALASTVRLSQHQEAFANFQSEALGGGDYRELRGSAVASMQIDVG